MWPSGSGVHQIVVAIWSLQLIVLLHLCLVLKLLQFAESTVFTCRVYLLTVFNTHSGEKLHFISLMTGLLFCRLTLTRLLRKGRQRAWGCYLRDCPCKSQCRHLPSLQHGTLQMRWPSTEPLPSFPREYSYLKYLHVWIAAAGCLLASIALCTLLAEFWVKQEYTTLISCLP
jgi:hypothetical protein